jgi:hypothetical protein
LDRNSLSDEPIIGCAPFRATVATWTELAPTECPLMWRPPCQKAKDVGYPHELWTTRLLARHAREHAPSAGHVCLARIAQGTVCKILAEQEVKPHKVRYSSFTG